MDFRRRDGLLGAGFPRSARLGPGQEVNPPPLHFGWNDGKKGWGVLEVFDSALTRKVLYTNRLNQIRTREKRYFLGLFYLVLDKQPSLVSRKCLEVILEAPEIPVVHVSLWFLPVVTPPIEDTIPGLRDVPPETKGWGCGIVIVDGIVGRTVELPTRQRVGVSLLQRSPDHPS